MNKVTAAMYQENKERYILVAGTEDGAPRCSYGNIQKWVGYDVERKEYVRFTKSVFLKLVHEKESQ